MSDWQEKSTLPSNSELCHLLGIEELRVGRQVLRDTDGSRMGAFTIRSFWRVEILPSFDPPLIICVVNAKGGVSRNQKCPDWIKGVVAISDYSFVKELDTDPGIELLNELHLFNPAGSICLDGVSYRLTFGTVEMEGVLELSNPTLPHLKKLEARILSVSRMIIGQSKSEQLFTAMETWAKYIASRPVLQPSSE